MFLCAPVCPGEHRHFDKIKAQGAEKRELNFSSYVNPTLSSEWALDPNVSWQLGLVHAKFPLSGMEPNIRAAPTVIQITFCRGLCNLEYKGISEVVATSWTFTNAGQKLRFEELDQWI